MPVDTWARLGFGAVCAVALACFFLFPTYPTYDSYYALIWGRDLLHLHLPDFAVYKAPTEHPLAIAFGAVISIFGQVADRIMILGAIASYVALVAGLFRLARLTFGPAIAFIAAALLLSRFDYDYLAAQGYLDFPYMALVVWAGALEVARPRRGTPVFILLALAGLLRPDAWLLSGLYWLWCSWPVLLRRAPGARRVIGYGVLTVSAPLIWAAVDTVVTGHPTYSLHSTTDLADALGRTQGITTLPGAIWHFMVQLDKLPLVWSAIAGLAIAVWINPRRVGVPLALLASGLVTFMAIGASGASVIERYLLTPAVFVMLFGAVALGGWSWLKPASLLRKVWIAAAIGTVLFGVYSAARTLSLAGIRHDLAFRNDTHVALAGVLNNSLVRDDLAHCGPLLLPDNKLEPDARWILDAPPNAVVAHSQAREDADAGDPALLERIAHGVAVIPLGDAVFTQAVVDPDDSALDEEPPSGFTRAFKTKYYAVYVNCSPGTGRA